LRCEWCNREVDESELKTIQVKHKIDCKDYQHPQKVCKECRQALRGLYRLVRR